MLPTAHRFKGQPGLWPMGAEAPAWIWVLPAPAGLLRIGTVRSPPILIAAPPHHPPAAPFLQGIPGWHLPCDPFMPLVSEPALQQWHPLPGAQWVFGGAPSPVMGYSPPTSVDFVPVFPHVFTASVPPRAGKRWVKKRLPKCQMFVNSAFSLDSAWVHPEEARIFQGQEKPLILANQISMALSRPPTTTRPRRTVVITPQSLAGVGPKRLTDTQSNQTIAITAASAASMMTVDSSEPHLGSAPSSAQPCCVFTLSPIKIPIMTAPFSSTTRRDSHITPLIPAHLTRLTAMSSPTVTIMATNLVEQASSDKSTDLCRTTPSTALILHTDRNNVPKSIDTKDNAVKPVSEADCLSTGNKPVASTPVPGSPWCIVWTGDDRVFFFNPQMQLSVWEKPVDLKNRGDIIRMIEDPPHKRKLETSASIKCEVSKTDDRPDDHSTKTKRNKMEPLQNIEQKELEKEEKTVKSSQVFTLPLEERSTHFKEMLLERGVSAFSTWEKELHKIVFDPRYLLLNSEERKQVFEQFVKIRIKEEFKEKKSKLLLAKEGFKKLLEESKVSPRTTFKEFSEKYCRDQRFRLVQKKKDQELFFNQYIHLLKKRDKENRLRLRKMR